jgi:uncharacterized small protein (DUF1192 family)
MDEDEQDRLRRLRQGPQRFQPAALDDWAVADLRDYIAALKAEIGRAEATIAAREKQRGAADAIFRRL